MNFWSVLFFFPPEKGELWGYVFTAYLRDTFYCRNTWVSRLGKGITSRELLGHLGEDTMF